MDDYISRKWLLENINTGMDIIQMMQAIIDAPAVDAVEVVRCRECKHFKVQTEMDPDCGPVDYKSCASFGMGDIDKDGFCAWGERNDAEETAQAAIRDVVEPFIAAHPDFEW